MTRFSVKIRGQGPVDFFKLKENKITKAGSQYIAMETIQYHFYTTSHYCYVSAYSVRRDHLLRIALYDFLDFLGRQNTKNGSVQTRKILFSSRSLLADGRETAIRNFLTARKLRWTTFPSQSEHHEIHYKVIQNNFQYCSGSKLYCFLVNF